MSKTTGGLAGIQCKEKDGLAGSFLTLDELKEEVAKAKKFRPALTEFIVATTGSRDGKIQQEARRLTKRHSQKGLFSVHVWCWEDIETELANYPHLLQKHYPDLFGSTVATQQVAKEVASALSEQVRATAIGFKQEMGTLLIEGLTEIKQDMRDQVGSELDAELTHAKKLIADNKPKICAEFLDQLIEKKWDAVSDKTRYKLLINKGSCLLGQAKAEEAGTLFVRALQFNRDDEKALVNAAFGYFILGEKAAALERIEQALEKNPVNLEAWTLRIQYSSTMAEIDKLLVDVPTALLEQAAINWARAIALQREGFLLEAEKYMNLALANSKDRRIDLLIQLAALKLKNTLVDATLVGTQTLTPEVRLQIESCVSLLSEALSRLSESEMGPIRIQALIDRGMAYRILGQADNAKRDLDQVIEWDPKEFEAVKQRAILSTEEDNYEEAIRLLKPFSEQENAYVAKLLLAETYRQAKNQKEAIRTLQDCEKWSGDNRTKINGLMIQVECYLDLLDKASALSVVEKMKRIGTMSFIPFLFQAKTERLFGQQQLAQQIALTAKSLVSKQVDFFDEWKLADELYAVELYADAAQIYSRLAVPERNDGLTRRLIESQYQADQWDIALSYCRRLRAHHPDVQYATEIACGILESAGNLQAGIEILREYLTLRSDDDHARLRLATCLRRDGKNEDSDRELAKVKFPDKLGPRDILHYASLLSAKGDAEKAIKILYEARRTHSNDPEIDMGFIYSILGRGERIAIMEEPKTVSVDTVVFLENSIGEKDFYIIEERTDADFLKKEVNLESSIAKELSGKKIGDTVDLEKNPIQTRLWTIKALKSKFAHALVETMDTHSKRFPSRQDFFRITTPTDDQGDVDTEELRKQLISTLPDERQRNTLEDFYKRGKLTIGSLAKLAGRDVLATMVYLGTRREVGIYASTGSQEEYDRGVKVLAASKGIVIDPSSIIIMESLKAKEWLNQEYGPFVIAQSTLDDFNVLLAQRSIGGRQPSLSIFREAGEIYKQEVSAEDKQKQLDALTALIEWLRKNCSLKPVELALAMNRAEREKMDKVFGGSFFDSMLLAKEHELTLYTEDGRFRGFVEAEHGVKGIWTHCLLKDAMARGIITDDQFMDHTISLLTLNVHHVSINAAILVAAARKASWRPDHPFASTLFNLSGLRCGENAAVVVAGEFLYTLWKEVLPPLAREVIVFAVLDALAAFRRRDTVTRKMEQFIANRFLLWPHAASALLGLVDSWKKSRLS